MMKLDLLALRDVILYNRDGPMEAFRYWEQPWTDDVFLFDDRAYAIFHNDGFVWHCALDSSKIPAYLKKATPQQLRASRSETSWKSWANIARMTVPQQEPTLFVMVADEAWQRGYTGDHRLTGSEYLSYPEEIFQEQARNGQSGRMIFYMQAQTSDTGFHLYFLPDGSGCFRGMVPYKGAYLDEIVDFTWAVSDVPALTSPADILTVPNAHLLPLCELIVKEQVTPRLKAAHGDPADLFQKLKFIRGNQTDLKRLTHCICHIDTPLWSSERSQETISVTFRARYVCSKSLLWLDGEQSQIRYSEARVFSNNTKQLLNLAFRENRFRGGRWSLNSDPDERHVSHFLHSGIECTVQIAPPSAHERAEALLTLRDWLDGRVSAGERNRLLGLS